MLAKINKLLQRRKRLLAGNVQEFRDNQSNLSIDSHN